jgi:hypothetical protein
LARCYPLGFYGSSKSSKSAMAVAAARLLAAGLKQALGQLVRIGDTDFAARRNNDLDRAPTSAAKVRHLPEIDSADFWRVGEGVHNGGLVEANLAAPVIDRSAVGGHHFVSHGRGPSASG